MNTQITTLTGNTSITTLVGTTNVTSPVGAINITSPIINSTGIWNHKGAFSVIGASLFEPTVGIAGALSVIGDTVAIGLVDVEGVLTASTVAGGIHTHTHPILSGSSAGTTGPGVG